MDAVVPALMQLASTLAAAGPAAASAQSTLKVNLLRMLKLESATRCVCLRARACFGAARARLRPRSWWGAITDTLGTMGARDEAIRTLGPNARAL